MVLLPNGDEEVLGGAQLTSSASTTELASEGTPAKVSIAPSPSPSSSSTASSSSVSVESSNSSKPSSNNTNDTTSTTTTTTTTTMATTVLVIDDDVKTTEGVTSDTTAATAVAGPLSPYRPSRVTLGSVNGCITCHLCKGYLIDATTIVECLHSFCHSCIIKHLHTEQYCPQCEVMINKAKPNIKPDVPLQSIVFKLVPELYENELRRRRDFYRNFPESAMLVTPAQRGEDTEHLIFSPNEQISLSLEYAESELAEDNKELLRARYLLCPAVFSIAMLKKFLVNKYGISERQFCVEIMYKVKTIVLPDYYTLMDVAYIYTWKRDAPMKYFYRIRTTETNPLELPEITLRRSPSLITALSSNKQQQKQQQQQQQQQPQQQTRQTQEEDEEDDKENMHLVPFRPPVSSSVSVSEGSVSELPGALTARPTTATTTTTATAVAAPGTPDVNGNRKMVTANGEPQSPATPTTVVARKNESIKLKIELNKNKYVSFLQSPQSDVPASQSSSSSSPLPSAGAGAGGFASPGSGGRVHKSDRPDKVKRKKTDAPRTQKIQEKMNEQMHELKLRIEKIKDHGLTMKKKKLAPYKVELSHGISQPESRKLHSSSKSSSGGASSGKVKVKSPKSHTSASPPEAPKHPIVLKIDQRSPDMATSTLKFEMKERKQSKTPSPPPFPPSPPSPPVKRFEDEKSQFLNSFQLAPIKTPAPTSSSTPSSPEAKEKVVAASPVTAASPPSPPKSPGGEAKKPTTLPTLKGSPNTKSSSPPREPSSTSVNANGSSNGNGTSNGNGNANSRGNGNGNGTSASLKRKAKDSTSLRSGPKKQKLSDDEIKALVEKKVAENIKSPSEHIVPPIFLKPKVPPKTPSVASPQPVTSPPLPSNRDAANTQMASKKSAAKAENVRAKCDSPRPFLYKMPPPPPPIVSVTNIPAVKPSQPVLPAPLPQKIVPPASMHAAKVPNGSAKAASAAQAPARRPTVPTKLPTSNAISSASNSSSTGASSSSDATTHNVASGAGGKFQKPLELKRAQSNPWLNIVSPAANGSQKRDTEISKLRPEDLKKNAKVYGPPPPPTPVTSTVSSSTSSSVTPSATTAASMPKLDSGNFAVPKPKPAPKPQQPVVSPTASTVAATSSTSTTSTTTKTPATSATAAAAGVKVRPVNYLNYALYNSKSAPAGSRTPIPSYSSSPSYSPDSPQYNPNLNISTKQFKYANPTAFSSYMQNMMNDRKPGTTSPPTPTSGSPASSPSPPHQQDNLPTPQNQLPPTTSTSNTTNSATPPASDRKRPASAISPDTTTKSSIEPPEKQPKVQSLLNKINIPSSLSITLATEEDEVARQTARKMNEIDPTNNFIEIVKLPEIPITEVVTSTDRNSPPVATVTSKKAGSPSPPGALSTPAIQVLPVTTATTTLAATSTASTPPSATINGAVSAIDSYQKQFLDSITPINKKAKTTPTTTTAASPAASVTKSSSKNLSSSAAQQPMPPRPSTPKVSPTAKYKNPNATVLENGNVKLHNYQDVDRLVKGFNGTGAASRTSTGASNGGSLSSSSAKLMPPPPAKTSVPIAPKSSPSGGSPSSVPQRKAISPPVMRSPSASSGILNGQPKSKTPPSILPSMASMGPMFGIQMKSDANASAANISLRRHSTSSSLNGSSYQSNPNLPRRKITPTSNSTSLVPVRSPSTGSSAAAGSPSSASLSPSSAAYKPMPPTVNAGDFITLHPQPSPMEQQQQLSQLQNFLANPYAMAFANLNRNPATLAHSQYYLQQLSQQHFLQQLTQQQQQLSQQQRNLVACPVTIGGTMGMATDGLTITATHQRVSSKQPVQPHSLTVTPIRGPNNATSSLSGKNGAGGGGGVGIGIGPAAKPQPRGGAGGIPGKPPGGAS